MKTLYEITGDIKDINVLLVARDEHKRMESDLLSLQKFADSIVGEFPDHGDADGFDIQEIAVASGLLMEMEMTEPCGEHCNCIEHFGDGEEKVSCCRVQPVLSRARLASALDSVRSKT